MTNKEFMNYLRVSCKLDIKHESVNYYIDRISDRDFEIKDIYLKLRDLECLNDLFLLKVCMLLCIIFDKKEVDKNLLIRILMEALKFRQDHFYSSKCNFDFILEDVVTSIMHSNNLQNIENNLRRIGHIDVLKRISIGGKLCYAQYNARGKQEAMVGLKRLSEDGNNYILLKDSFNLIRNGKIEYKNIYGLGFINDKVHMIKASYQDEYPIFDYLIY